MPLFPYIYSVWLQLMSTREDKNGVLKYFVWVGFECRPNILKQTASVSIQNASAAKCKKHFEAFRLSLTGSAGFNECQFNRESM